MAITSNNIPRPPREIPGMGGGVSLSGWRINKTSIALGNGCYVGAFAISNGGDLVGRLRGNIQFDEDGRIKNIYDDDVLGFSRVVDGSPLVFPANHNTVILGASNYRFKSGYFVNLYSSGGFTTGDLIFKNNWVITEEDESLVFINPKGKKVLELTPDGEFKKVKDDKTYDNAKRFNEGAEEHRLKKPEEKPKGP
jgi:hypothetical protein